MTINSMGVPLAILQVKECNDNKRFYLGEHYPNLYLTEREAEIILLMQDLKYADIAQRLAISRRTVEHYSERLQYKFQCRSKRHLVKKLYASGLISQLKHEVIIS